MLEKVFIILIMLAILYCLGSGLYYLVHDQSKSQRMVKSLSWRIGLSVVLFLLLFLGFALGLIRPHGIYNI